MNTAPTDINDAASPERISLWMVLKDLSFVSWLFAAIVGAPSILSLVQIVFIEYRPTELLQWILDGYEDLLDVLTGFLAPLAAVVIDLVRDWLEVPLVLQDHWQSLFVLLSIFISANTRSLLDDNYPKTASVFLPIMIIAVLAGSWAAGVIPADGVWWLQGLAVGLPVLILFLGMTLAYAIASVAFGLDTTYRKPLHSYVLRGIFIGVSAFLIAGAIDLTGLIDSHAGIFTLFTGMAIYGLYWLRAGLVDSDLPEVRFGLRLVGGFAFAALIVLLDIVYAAI